MPSPFPGMDPWLESPEHSHNVHRYLIALFYADLNARLPDGFAATIDENVYLATPDERYQPDVAVLATPRFAAARNPSITESVALPQESGVEVIEWEEEIREPFVQVVTTHGHRRVVAVIELLSPINKTGQPREAYRKKQWGLLESDMHLLEIDLLRSGQHTVAVSEGTLLAQYGEGWDHLVCLHRARSGWRFRCWPLALRDPLPTVPLPLTAGIDDLALDLGALFTRCYDEGAFRRLVDYRQPPVPRLKPSDAAWAAEWLRAVGRGDAEVG